MPFLKSTAAFVCSVALAVSVLPDQADAHGFLLLPKPEFTTDKKNFYAYVVPGKSVPPENAYFTGDAERNSQGFKKNYAAGNWKTLKDFIFKLQVPSGSYEDRPAGGTAECGFTVPTAKPQPLPNQLEYGNYALTIKGGIHPGPCEAWCDDEIIVPFTEDCRTILFKPIPYAKDKCVGKSRLTFYWVATHFAPFQVYTSCVPLQGATGGNSNTPAVTSKAPAAATTKTPAAATTKAPAAATTKAPSPSSNSGGAKPTPTTAAPVKCKRQRVADPPAIASASAAAAADEFDSGAWEDGATEVDDTLAAVQLLASRAAAGFAALALPPLVLWHQLYTVFPNRTFVDQNVHRLRTSGALVTIRVPTGADEVALLSAAAYKDELEKWLCVLRDQRERQATDPSVARRHDALARFVRVLSSISRLPSIPARVLVDEMQARRQQTPASGGDAQTTEDDIVWLQRLGFLRQLARLDNEVFHLSLPGVGRLVSAVKKSRAALLTSLQRAQFKEVAEKQLKKTRLKHSRLDWDFHLADMDGLGLIRRTKVTSGTLVALAQR